MARNPNDNIIAYRKKKKRKAYILKLVLTLFAAMALAFLWIFRAEIFEPLRGIASRAGSTGVNEGFPIVLSGSARYSMNRMDNNFLLLSDTYLYIYNNRGGQIFSHRHNYARPFQRATDRRALLFNFSGYEFSLFSRTERIYEVKLEDKIVLAELGSNDMAAVVTTSSVFSNILYIYDRNGRWQYTRRFVDEEVNAAAFASGSGEIIVATSTVRGGEVFSKIYRLRTDESDDLIWEKELPPGAWALGVRENGNYVTILADNAVFSLDSETGDIAGSYAFDSGTLDKSVFGTNFNLVILKDYVTDNAIFVTLDRESGLIKQEILPFEVKKVEIFGEIVYTLTRDLIYSHDMFLTQTGVTELDDEYRDFIILGGDALLLGYETVEQKTLE